MAKELHGQDKESDNPFRVVREEITTEMDGDVTVTQKKGYDSRGRLVSDFTYRDYGKRGIGHAGQCVEADGFWHGGAYDPIIGQGCTFAPVKFEEQ